MTKLSKRLPDFPSKAFLAPMAGLSDPALRLICKGLGAGLVVTEFVNIHAIVAKDRILKEQQEDIQSFIEYSEEERPLSCQIFGSDLDQLEKAIKIVEPFFDIIDYNMGCPAPHVTQQMACSALLQEPELTREIFRTMVKTSSKPISVKIRSGITKPDRWKEIALIAEEEGISMITLHPRTVKQGYSGKADWSLIKELKQLVSIPVVGNGDIETPEDAKRMLQETGCDYVMIGRGAARNPFLFSQIHQYFKFGKYKEATPLKKVEFCLKYFEYVERFKTIKFSSMRMQAMNFTKGLPGSKALRGRIINTVDKEDLKNLVNNFYLEFKKKK